MASLGGGYAEAVEFVRKADRAEVLGGKLVIDAIPREFEHSAAGRVREDRPDAGEGERGSGARRDGAARGGRERLRAADGAGRAGHAGRRAAGEAAAQPRPGPALRAEARRPTRRRSTRPSSPPAGSSRIESSRSDVMTAERTRLSHKHSRGVTSFASGHHDGAC